MQVTRSAAGWTEWPLDRGKEQKHTRTEREKEKEREEEKKQDRSMSAEVPGSQCALLQAGLSMVKLNKHARMNARKRLRKGKSLQEVADLYGVPPQEESEAAKGVDRTQRRFD